MKRVCPLAFLLLYCSLALAQKHDYPIHLKTGRVAPESNISSTAIEKINQKAERFDNSVFALLQFESVPTEEVKSRLAAQGITLLEYIPHYTYTVSIRGKLSLALLKEAGARVVMEPSPQQKMFPALAEESLTPGAKGYRDVWVSFPKTFTASEVLSQLKALNYEITSAELSTYRILVLRVSLTRLAALAGLPFIEYVQPAPPKDEPLNFNSRALSRARVLNASVAHNGKGLNGEGVVIGIGDNANVLSHVDLAGRIIDHTIAGAEVHGMHVTGTAAGAGILSELNRGYAPKAMVVSQTFSNIIFNAPSYIQQFGMIATNNSYGNNLGCTYTGTYDLNARVLDQQAIDYPHLQHVFAAGNSGTLTCAPLPMGFRTVLGGFQSAKNVISVGNIDANENVFSGSSKGPVRDGRLKPEITALGTSVVSTFPNNTYASSGGTSMAAPAVTGGVALLYQRYRQLHSNVNPKSGLIKAFLCNGASDRGNSGPDFSYGFGSMNLLRSVDMLERNRFMNDSVANGGEKQYTINVPANTAQLKVMLYWHDPAASALSAKTLVNDLDLTVTSPLSQTLFPKILDTSTVGITTAATTGPDHTNNMEQVSVDDPEPGNYTIRVTGGEIAQNPRQEFFVVYDIVPNSIVVTYPAGGEGLAPGENTRINWEAYGDTSSTFSLAYSTDEGATWTNIATGIRQNSHFFAWKVPATAKDKALIKVVKEATGQSATSNPFNIIGVPVVSLSPVQCEGYVSIRWAAVANATDYEIMRLKDDEMIPVATTAETTYTFKDLSKDSTYWVSVRARINGKEGRRAIAISRKPDNGTCAGSISDNDLALQAMLSPVSGRRFTSSELTNATTVRVEIRNLDDVAVQGFAVQYSIDGGNTWTTENVTSTIAPGKVYTHSFSRTADLSATGDYKVLAVVKAAGNDGNNQNDTLSRTVRHLDNQPLDLTVPFVDNIEAALPETYIAGTMGLNGLERYDLFTSTPFGRLRTFFNSGFAASGTKAFNLDAYRLASSSNVNSLVGTFNLAGYDVSRDELRLDFRAFGHGQDQHANNKVWVRQSDTSAWIEVYDLNKNASKFNNRFGLADNIEFGDSLLKYGQNVSSSFQIKWGQQGRSATINGTGNDGYSFDDIRIFRAADDIQLVSIDAPSTVHCGIGASLPLKITLRNGANTAIANIPVRYAINDGAWSSEVISSLAGNTTMAYTFTNGLNFSATGIYHIKVVADVATDSYRLNDTASITVRSLPYIASFPYLENFEQGDGGWYADGANNSWKFGTPASPQIKKAASGSKAWKTGLNGIHNNEELSYLYSPCFDISGIQKPTLSFSIALDIENCGNTFCDAAWVEYSTDGKTWSRLVNNAAFNWYGNGFYWAVENKTRWHAATVPLPVGENNIRLRFAFFSDAAVSREGIAIDDIHIYEGTKAIYDGETLATPVTQTINGGAGWTDFESGGKLIASIHPGSQSPGVMDVRTFIHKDSVRHHNSQYYLDRSFTIHPSNMDLQDSVTLRLYFLDKEVEALVNAIGCNCSKPASAYDLGVSVYEDSTAFENGTVEDNKRGIWSFYPRGSVTKVPFDKGYYAEFKVKGFSEFWLSNGGIGGNSVLPVKLMNLNVRKEGNTDAVVSWTVESESNVDHYEIEVARGTGNGQQSGFEKIGEVSAKVETTQQQQYSFTDREFPKSGIRYYRLKIMDLNGTFTYSNIRSLVFPDTKDWIVYPNPSEDGKFYFVYKTDRGEAMTLQLTDAIGRSVKTYQLRGNGYAEKLLVDISAGTHAKGVYFLKVAAEGREQVFKLNKQ